MGLATALDILRQIGAKRFALDIPVWVVRRRYIFYAGSYGRSGAAAGSGLPPYPFRLDVVREQDLPQLVSLRPALYALPQLQARLDQGHLALVGRSRETIVHIRWVFVGSVYLSYLSRRLVLAPGEGYLDEVYTVPAWRRRGVEAAAAVQMREVLRARGLRRIIYAIAEWNRTPQRIGEAHGNERVGTGGYWNILGHKSFFWEGGVRDHGDGDLSVGAAPGHVGPGQGEPLGDATSDLRSRRQ
jgi:hypothetical protein